MRQKRKVEKREDGLRKRNACQKKEEQAAGVADSLGLFPVFGQTPSLKIMRLDGP